MLVSIVIPVYNVEKYLDACVESVLKLQSDWEAILVDDGSTDESGRLCDRWADKDSRISTVHQKNGGLSAARNTGIRNAQGEYVLFLDSDDFLDFEETDRMLAELNGKPDILFGLYREYDSDTGKTQKEACDGFLSVGGNISAEQFLKTVPADGQSCYMTAWRFVVKREYLLNNQLFFMPGILHEDEEWTSRLLCSAESICVTHFYFYQYRQARAGSITAKVRPKNIRDRFTIMESMLKAAGTLASNSEKAQYLSRRMAQLYLSNMLDSRVLSKEEWKTAEEQFKKYADCTAFMCGKVGSIVKIFNKLIGTKRTCKLLKYVYRLREHD